MILDDLRSWDGVWRVERPASFTPGLYRLHQIDAHSLLNSGHPWTEAQARMLQAMFYQHRDLSELQRHWLNRFEQDAERAAA